MRPRAAGMGGLFENAGAFRKTWINNTNNPDHRTELPIPLPAHPPPHPSLPAVFIAALAPMPKINPSVLLLLAHLPLPHLPHPFPLTLALDFTRKAPLLERDFVDEGLADADEEAVQVPGRV